MIINAELTTIIVETAVLVIGGVVLYLKTNKVGFSLKNIDNKMNEVDFTDVNRKIRENRLDILKMTIYIDHLPLIDKYYNFLEYIKNGGNHGVIEYMKPEILKDKKLFWSVFEKEREILPTKGFEKHFEDTITDIRVYLS